MKTLIGDLPYICGCVGYLVDCTMFVSRLFLDIRKQLYSLMFIGGAWFDAKWPSDICLVSFAAWFAMEFRNLVAQPSD